MEGSTNRFDALIGSGARRLTGFQRRLFMAEVTHQRRDGNPRHAERRLGWGRDPLTKGLHELRPGVRGRESFAARGR